MRRFANAPELPLCVVVRPMLLRVDVLEAAAERGFSFEERPLRGQWVFGWRRGDDTPVALLWLRARGVELADRLRRVAVFER